MQEPGHRHTRGPFNDEPVTLEHELHRRLDLRFGYKQEIVNQSATELKCDRLRLDGPGSSV